MKKAVFLILTLVMAASALTACASHEHTPTETPEVAPTCAAAGSRGGTHCLECGEVLSEPEAVPMLQHTPAEIATNKPTCTESGVGGGLYCIDCGAVIKVPEKLSPLGHDLSPATCTAAPSCLRCGAVEGEPKGHAPVKLDAIAPTCTEEGRTEGSTCSVCSETLVESVPVPASGHTISVTPAVLSQNLADCRTESASCTACGMIQSAAVHPEQYTSRYAYDYLGTMQNGAAMQKLYDIMAKESLNFHLGGKTLTPKEGKTYGTLVQIDIVALGLSREEASAVWMTFLWENPQYYWYHNSYSMLGNEIHLLVSGDYLDAEVRRDINLKLYAAVQGITSDKTALYDRIKDYHDTILQNLVYETDAAGNPSEERWAHNVVGYVLYGRGVCETYSEIFSMVLNYNGIPCMNITGIGHEWNLVKMDDGKWYWFDPTFNDGDNTFGHTFFCVTDDEPLDGGVTFLGTHRLNYPVYGDYFFVGLPERAAEPYKKN